MKKKQLYYVKREVLATSMQNALKQKGFVYEITLAPEANQPQPQSSIGFKKNNGKQP